MRTRNKVLAFVLAMLMIVGMLPLSVLAAAGNTKSTETTQTREEWVAANGGTMLLGTSFDDPSKIGNMALSKDGTTVSSDAGMGSGTVGRVNMGTEGGTKVWVDTNAGALKFFSNDTPADYWPTLNTRPVNGQAFTVEMTLKFNKHLITTSKGLMYINQGDVSNTDGTQRVDTQLVYYTYVDAETWGLSLTGYTKDVFVTFKLGEAAHFAITFDPVTFRVSVYAGGKYVGTGRASDNNLNSQFYNDVNVKGYPDPSTIRILQITDIKNLDFELQDVYAYCGVDKPYGTDVASNVVSFGQYLYDNSFKLNTYTDFENMSWSNWKDFFVSRDANPNGYGYLYLFSRSQRYFTTMLGKEGLQINAAKNAVTSVLRDEYSDGYFLRLASDLKAASNTDVYLDFYPAKGLSRYNQLSEGDTYVISGDFRKGITGSSAGYNLLNVAFRVDGKRKEIINITANEHGRITFSGTASAKNKTEIGYISAGEEFTNIALIANTTANTFSIAIDGVIVIENEPLAIQDILDLCGGDSKKVVPSEVRVGQQTSNNTLLNGHLDIDNLLCYSGASNKLTNDKVYGVHTVNDGWNKSAEGYWYYYNNGVKAIGTQTIDGKVYSFGADGRFSTLERTPLVMLDKIDTATGGFVESEFPLGYSTDVHTSQWNQSALWTHIYKEGGTGNVNGSDANSYGTTSLKINATGGMINPALVRTLTSYEEMSVMGVAADAVTGTVSVIDLSDYAAIEVDWYIDKAVDLTIKGLYQSVNNNYYKYAKYDGMQSTASGTAGWRTHYLDLTRGGNKMVPGAVANVMGNRPATAISYIQLSLDWDGANKDNYLDDVKIYIGAINVIKYKAVKSEVCPAELGQVRVDRTNGIISIYAENMSEPTVGWTEVGGNKYYTNAEGIAQTGVVTIGSVSYFFDDNGKLVGNATGIYTINGKNYFFENGVAKAGDFTYNGSSFTTKGDGEIVSMDGIIPGFTTGVFTKPSSELYSALTLKNVGSFDARPVSGNGSYLGNINNKEYSMNIADANSGSSAINAYAKRTKFHFVDDGNGGAAIKLYNESLAMDSFLNVEVGARKENSFVFEASYKLGEDWNTQGSLFYLQDRTESGNPSFNVGINREGYVYSGNDLLCKLSTTEFTNIAVVHNYSGTNVNVFDIYVNGVKVISKTLNNAKFRSPTLVRIMHYNRNDGHGSLIVDDIYTYEASAPVYVDTTSVTKNGLVTEAGLLRYYENGVAKAGVVTVAGKKYSFNTVNGVGVNGFDANGYYCVNGEIADYEGVVTIDGKDYYFNADNKAVKNATKVANHLNPAVSYDTDADGVIVKTYIYDSSVTSDAGTIANSPKDNETYVDGKVVFVPEIGKNVFVSSKFYDEFPLFEYDEAVDLNGYDYVRVEFYLSEYFVGKSFKFAATVGRDLRYYEITGYNPETNTYESIDFANPLLGIGSATNTGKTIDGKAHYQVYSTGSGDNIKYYLRDWEYAWKKTDAVVVTQPGIVTFDIPLSLFTDYYLSIVESFKIATTGWSINTTDNAGFDNTKGIGFVSATLLKYEEPTSAINGWNNGRFYEEGIMKTGWFNYEGIWYYLDPTTGYKTTGIASVPALPMERAAANTNYFYEFNNVGFLVGYANGIIDSTSWVKVDGVYTEIASKRIVKNGVVQNGLQNVGGDKYFVDPTTYAIVTNSSFYADTDNDPSTPDEFITTDENGVIEPKYNAWVEVDGKYFYYDAAGKLETGYNYIALDKDGNEGGYYFFDTVTNEMLVSAWQTVYGAEMFFTANGKAANGLVIDAVLADRGALDNTGYFVNGVPATTEFTDGAYKYIFINGMLDSKIAIETDAPEILIWVLKDGQKTPFYFPVNADKSFTKTFSSYPCYVIEIYDVTDVNAPVKLEITDNTLVIAAGSTSTTYEVRYNATAHNYVEKPELQQDPTCRQDGTKVFVCSECGSKIYETIKATGEHVYGEYSTLIEANCTTEGLKIRYCECGVFEEINLPRDPFNHNIIHDPNNPYYTYKAPTCTEDGYESGVCGRCGMREDITILPATGHSKENIQWSVDVVATCISKGTEKGLCANGCGEYVYRDTAIDPEYHAHGVNGTIAYQNQAGEYFALFKIVVPSTCQTPGTGIFNCLDCGGFIGDEKDPSSLVILDLDLNNHDGEWGDEYLVVFDSDGNIIETVRGNSREEMIANSSFICGYSGAWRMDCTNPNCVLEDGQTRIFKTVELAVGNGNHIYDFNIFYTTDDDMDPLYGKHYYVCQKCDKALQATDHVMSDIRLSADGQTHIIYCAAGCVYEVSGAEYCITVNCEFALEQLADGDEVYGHGYVCECGYTKDVVTHDDTNTVVKYNDAAHWILCEVCGYTTEPVDHVKTTVAAQIATCYQPGWDEYEVCDCGYHTAYAEYAQLPHNLSGSYHYDDQGIGHWIACSTCDFKYKYAEHTMSTIFGFDATCTDDGLKTHTACSVCGWIDPNSFVGESIIIDAYGHNVEGQPYHVDDDSHWQYCANCTEAIIEDHEFVMNENFYNYNDEEGTADHKCEVCHYVWKRTGLNTWWSVLGLVREGEEGAYGYYLYVDGVKKTDYIAYLADGTIRYFDNDGKLVMGDANKLANGAFDTITDYGYVTFNALIDYYGYTERDNKAAERGALYNAIIDSVDGIMMIENGVVVTGWKLLDIEGGRYYYFNGKLGGNLVNANIREGVLVKSTVVNGNLTITAPNLNGDAAVTVNVREDGSRLLGVIDNGDGTASLYIDGTAGKMPAGWVSDSYTDPSQVKVYFVLNDRTLASGKYVLTPGGIYWNFDETTYLRAENYCRNEITTDGVYINAEGKAASNELVTLSENGKTYFIVMTDGVQSVYTEKNFVLAANVYYMVDTATGEITGLYTGMTDEDSYALNGAQQISTFCAIDGKSYYFDGNGNMLKGTAANALVVYIKSATEGAAGMAWSFDADGVATAVNNSWVYFLGEDGNLSTANKGYYFDSNKGLAYGLQDSSIVVGDIYIFDDNGYLYVNVASHDYNGVIYVIDENGKAKAKDEDEE